MFADGKEFLCKKVLHDVPLKKLVRDKNFP
jgi:hypothetical protein